MRKCLFITIFVFTSLIFSSCSDKLIKIKSYKESSVVFQLNNSNKGNLENSYLFFDENGYKQFIKENFVADIVDINNIKVDYKKNDLVLINCLWNGLHTGSSYKVESITQNITKGTIDIKIIKDGKGAINDNDKNTRFEEFLYIELPKNINLIEYGLDIVRK